MRQEGAGDAVRPRRALSCIPGGNRARGTQARVAQRDLLGTFVADVDFARARKRFWVCVLNGVENVHISYKILPNIPISSRIP